MNDPEALDGCYELIDGEVFESMGMFATYREALEWAWHARLTAWEIWRDNELIETKEREAL